MGCVATTPTSQPALPQSELPTLLAQRRNGRVSSQKTITTPSFSPRASTCAAFGGAVRGVHHIALVVRDVGDSLFFYTDVVGFEPIDRPSFDRHGAWLTMGNIQLHLIKGQPHVNPGQHPKDLIVSHIALDVDDADAVLSRLRAMAATTHQNLSWRQNLSVPTKEASGKARFESDHTNANGKLTQFFLEDPDGYWLEFCNCGDDETKQSMGSASSTSAESSVMDFWANPENSKDAGGLTCIGLNHPGHRNTSVRRFVVTVALWARITIQTKRWVQRTRRRLCCEQILQQELAYLKRIQLSQVDADKFECLCSRRNTYGDICQGFSDQELKETLAQAGNDIPGTILLLKNKRRGCGQVYCPPCFLDHTGVVVHTEPFRMKTYINSI